MTEQIAIVLSLLATAMVLLATELIPAELVALLLVAALVISGIHEPEIAFQGFASETVVMLACVMVLSRRLAESGLMSLAVRKIVRRPHVGPRRTTAALMAVSSMLSTVFTNTSTTAVLIPVVTDIAKRTGLSPKRLLMPVAFASMMGGSATLIGTSTNLATSGALVRSGHPPFAMFEFAVVGIIISLAGILFMAVWGAQMLPETSKDQQETDAPTVHYHAQLVVPEKSTAIGQRVRDLDFDAFALTSLAVSRDRERMAAHPMRKLEAGDRIFVHGSRDAIMHISTDKRFASETGWQHKQASEQVFAEAVLMPGARWLGQTLHKMRQEFAPALHIHALHRRGQTEAVSIDRMRLKTADRLLLSGASEDLEKLTTDPDLALLMTPEPAPPSRTEGWVTLCVFALAIAAGTVGLVPHSVALLVAVLALILSGRMSLPDAFGKISWRILILIGGMSSFGIAMLQTGTAAWVADIMLDWLSPFGPRAVLLGIALATILLTQPMSNAAAALTVLPIGLEIAEALQVDPRPFAVTIALSASLSFIAPFEPALLLVYAPGDYRLRDFPRAGLPLTILTVGLLLLIVPVLWPFTSTSP